MLRPLVRTSSPALIPRGVRRRALAVALAAGAVFLVLAARYAGGSDPRWFDDHARDVLTDVTPRSRALRMLLELGSPASVVTIAVVVALLCLWMRRPRAAALALLGPGITGLVTTFTKPLIGRTLRGEYAYPSGHTGGATSTALVLAILAVLVLRPDPRRALAIVLAVGAAAAAMFAVLVVVANWHYATDAIGGACVALAAVLGTALAIDAVADRWTGRAPDPPGPGAGPASLPGTAPGRGRPAS
ncbi:phosphatase PAP2 family protein [Pseudonocardia sp.]|uniref:phosphatase PAP2 family protein n=1 Tax=Pseudonocardia sp. TaxID=60912 RepID=UPI003D121B48